MYALKVVIIFVAMHGNVEERLRREYVDPGRFDVLEECQDEAAFWRTQKGVERAYCVVAQ